MKILLVNKFYYPHAGAEIYFLALERALKAAGHTVAVFATAHPKNLPSPWEGYFPPYDAYGEREGVVKDTQKFFRMVWSHRAAAAFARLCDDFQPEVIHAHNLYHHLSPSLLAVAKRRNIPVVQTLHDFKLLCPNYQMFTEHGPCERCHVYQYWNTIAHKCVDGSLLASTAAAVEMWVHRFSQIYETDVARFITPSHFLRELLISWKKDPGQIIHIPNMLDLAHLPARQPGAGEGMVYVGRLEEQKGVLTLLDAAAYVPRIPITIVGDGPLYPVIRDRIAKEGLTHITMTGRLSSDEVYDRLQHARAAIVPSAGYDIFPTVALEAGALGRPVVASRIGGLSEIVLDERTGILVPPQHPHALAEAMRTLTDNPKKAEAFGDVATHHIRTLVDPSRHVQRILAVYQEVMRQL